MTPASCCTAQRQAQAHSRPLHESWALLAAQLTCEEGEAHHTALSQQPLANTACEHHLAYWRHPHRSASHCAAVHRSLQHTHKVHHEHVFVIRPGKTALSGQLTHQCWPVWILIIRLCQPLQLCYAATEL